MRVGVYNEPSGGTLGGCESSVAWVAHAARSLGHSVEVIHHQDWLRLHDLEAFAGASLDGVDLRYVSRRPTICGSSWLPWRRFAEARQEGAEVSAGYDMFICLVHGIPPFNHSVRGALAILFPLIDVMDSDLGWSLHSFRQRTRHLYTRWEWSRRLASYDMPTAISRFTAGWCRRRWGVSPSILYPPVDVTFPSAVKARRIVTIGRFTRKGHPKCQDVLLEAFRTLDREGQAQASMTLVGSLSESPEDQTYFGELQRGAVGLPVALRPNASRAAIVSGLAEAMVYWHAAGFGEPDDRHPERMEHFGISTVEAMAAGCVPVVINRGGQPEIVEHGVSGFVWETPEELTRYTQRLLSEPTLRERMSAAARQRAQAFSIERFRREIGALLDQPVPTAALGATRQPERAA